MEKLHSLLKRQIKRNFENINVVPDTWQTFIKDVNNAYHQMDLDRAMLERSLDLSSLELLQANSEMRAILGAFPDLLFRTNREGIILDYQTSHAGDVHFLQTEVIGTPISNVFPGNVGKKFDEAIAQVYKINSPVNTEFSIAGMNGECCYEARFLPVLENQIIIIVRDITERTRAEEALRDSENRYRTIFENTGTAMIIIDGDNTTSLVNTELLKQSGYSEAEIDGKEWTEFIVKEDLEKLKEYYRRRGMDAVPIPRKYEARLIDKNGQIRNVYITVSLIPGTDMRVASLQDFTEIKRIENTLREREQYLRWITENMKDLLFHLDLQGKIKYRLPVRGGMLGYSEDDAIGKSAFDFIHPDDYDTAREAFQTLIATGQGRAEIRLRHSDGHYLWMELLGSVLEPDEAGRSGIIVVCRDVTDRKKTGEALRESEQRLQDIFDFLPDATFAINSEGKIIAWNRAIEEMTGVKAGDMLGKTNYEYSLPFYKTRRPILIDLVLRSNEEIEKKYLFVKNEGDVLLAEADVDIKGTNRVLWAKARPLYDSKSNVVGAIQSIRDITESKKLEAQFLQAQKMEAIGTLAGGIAHDFNNILMGIAGHASLMLFDLKTDHPHYPRLKTIESQVKSGAELTRQLLGFARRGKYDVQPTNLNTILENTSSMFGRTRREITIHQKFQKDLLAVEVDRGQIEQVLLNIYVNAWQVMPGRGEIFLETMNVTIDKKFGKHHAVKPGNYVKILITDKGTGMDEKTKERIFDPFFTTKEMGRGTGLGLASAYGIIKNHGGIHQRL